MKRSLEKLQALVALDDEVLFLTTEEAIEVEILQSNEVKERIYTALSRLEHAMRSATPVLLVHSDSLPVDLLAVDVPVIDRPGPPSSDSTPITPGAKVKLPKISLDLMVIL